MASSTRSTLPSEAKQNKPDKVINNGILLMVLDERENAPLSHEASKEIADHVINLVEKDTLWMDNQKVINRILKLLRDDTLFPTEDLQKQRDKTYCTIWERRVHILIQENIQSFISSRLDVPPPMIAIKDCLRTIPTIPRHGEQVFEIYKDREKFLSLLNRLHEIARDPEEHPSTAKEGIRPDYHPLALFFLAETIAACGKHERQAACLYITAVLHPQLKAAFARYGLNDEDISLMKKVAEDKLMSLQKKAKSTLLHPTVPRELDSLITETLKRLSTAESKEAKSSTATQESPTYVFRYILDSLPRDSKASKAYSSGITHALGADAWQDYKNENILKAWEDHKKAKQGRHTATTTTTALSAASSVPSMAISTGSSEGLDLALAERSQNTNSSKKESKSAPISTAVARTAMTSSTSSSSSSSSATTERGGSIPPKKAGSTTTYTTIGNTQTTTTTPHLYLKNHALLSNTSDQAGHNLVKSSSVTSEFNKL